MDFKTDIYIGLKYKYHYNEIAYGSFIAVLLIIGLLPIDILNKYWIISLLIGILILLPFLMRIFNFIIPEVYIYSEDIDFQINTEKIMIGKNEYLWQNIKKIDIVYDDYDGKQYYRGKGDYRPTISAGFNNTISFTTSKGEIFKYNFRLFSSFQIDLLKKVFEKMAEQKSLPLNILLDLYQPENYAETQKLKNLYNSN